MRAASVVVPPGPALRAPRVSPESTAGVVLVAAIAAVGILLVVVWFVVRIGFVAFRVVARALFAPLLATLTAQRRG